jgi:hypothetical protein
MKIGLLSDTHGWLDPQVFDYFQDRDEIWHAGDIGDVAILEKLEKFKPLKAVYGNIDDRAIRTRCPEYQALEREGLQILMIHISGKPPYYTAPILAVLQQQVPDILVGGHSHILQVVRDPKRPKLLYLNPGAAGKHGFHQVRTLLRFEINSRKISNMQAIELGPRSVICSETE